MRLVPSALMAVAIACIAASLVGCELLRRYAVRRSLFDSPNDRSLHTLPTPRLGGLAIVATTLAAAVLGWRDGDVQVHVVVLVGGATALLGLRDDIRPVSAGTRLVLQGAAALAFLLLVPPPPLLVARGLPLPIPSLGVMLLLGVWLVGVLNIYNFMDGMDGLAGAQTILASAAFLVLLAGGGMLALVVVALGASSIGFVSHNFPPARIFMGDAGSTFIGITFAMLAVVGMHHGVPITETALPLTPFLLDGTFTLFRRALRKERVWTAHRSHLYQRAVQTGLGHRDVLLVYIGWMCVASGGAVLARHGVVHLIAAWSATVLGLLVVWRWVVRRESDHAKAPKPRDLVGQR